METPGENNLQEEIKELNERLYLQFSEQFNRSLPFNEMVFDRWERAKKLGFGEKSSIFDSSFVFGKPKVGKNCWIGPFTILDGSGGLEIGDNCTISSGVEIYTHDSLAHTLTNSLISIQKEKVVIGNNVYIGPKVVIKKGVTIGNFCVIGAMSFVNKNIPDYAISFGIPAKIQGKVIVNSCGIKLNYFEEKEGDKI